MVPRENYCLCRGLPLIARSILASLLFIGILSATLLAAESSGEDGVVAPVVRPDPVEAANRIDALRAEIACHDELYFKKAAPVISDGAYDRLKQELAALLAAFPQAVKEGKDIEADVGDDRVGSFTTYRHRVRMLSLNKSYSEKELRAFDARLRKQLGERELDYVVEPKFDGLAISVTFEKGKLVRAVTRGNGVEGDDVTANVLTIQNLPHGLSASAVESRGNPIPDIIELRGEVFLTFAEFNRINHERESAGEMPFAVPRNLATGTLKQTDPAEVAKRKLEIVFYGIGACAPTGARPASQLALLRQLREWGLPTVDVPRSARGADAMWKAVQAVGKERAQLGFPIDGAVVKVDALALQDRLGVTTQAPLWAIAYKFVPDRVETQLRAITLQIGRTGVITPVAELVPVKLGGSAITRASLFNGDEIRRRDIRVGDFVYIEKAGEIIPSIAGVNRARRVPESRPYEFPVRCPGCDGELKQILGETAVRCPNMDCIEQIKRRIEHFASADGVAISGLGPVVVDKLVQKGLVRNIADLYRLRREDLLTINAKTEKSATRLLAAIERSKHAELWRFINGFGIPNVGPAAARNLARHFGGFEKMTLMGMEDLTGKQSRGSVVSELVMEQVRAYFLSAENRRMVNSLTVLGVQPQN